MLVKLTRFERLENLVAGFKEQTKALFKVGRVTIQLLIYLHIVCCSWYFCMKRISPDWIPPMEVGALKTDVRTFIHFFDKFGSFLDLY